MYDVVILIEREMDTADAAEVVGLRDQSGEPTRYWVVLPVDDAAARVEASLGTIAANEPFGAAPILLPDLDLDAIQKEIVESSRAALEHSLQRLREAGGHADGEVINVDPVDALAKSVVQHQAAEVIVLTRPHLVSEFFHVDWTSKARRRLGVPLLHLVEIGVEDGEDEPASATSPTPSPSAPPSPTPPTSVPPVG
jgi:hypothetical protein